MGRIYNSCYFYSFRDRIIEINFCFLIMCLTGTGKSLTEKRRGWVYCIAVLAVDEKEGQDYAKYIIDYCTERSIFP